MKPRLRVITHINIAKCKIKYRIASLRIVPRQARTKTAKAHVNWRCRLSFCLLLACLSPPPIFATTIVIIRLEDEILIAADSDGTFYERGKVVGHKPVCKIFSAGNLYFGVSALAGNPATNFSVPSFVQGIVETQRGLEENADNVAHALKERLLVEFHWMRQHDAANLKPKTLAGKEPFSSIVFVGFEHHVPLFTVREFKVTRERNRKWGISVRPFRCPGDCPPSQYTLLIGEHKVIDRFIAERKKTGKTHFGDVSDAIRALIRLEIDAKTPGVAGPIDVLRIGKEGAKWICQKADCDNEYHKGVGCGPERITLLSPGPEEKRMHSKSFSW